MKIDISDIVKINGASMDFEVNEKFDDLNVDDSSVILCSPIDVKGKLTNMNGVLELSGKLNTDYTVKCYRCLKDVDRSIGIEIKEVFVNAEKTTDLDAYTYEGNFLVVDKAVKDNIILSLPMKQLCETACKGLCPRCGTDLNNGACECEDDVIDTRMEALKDFFKS